MDKESQGGDFPGGPAVKDLPCNAADVSLTPGWGTKGFQGGSAGKDCLQCERPGFDPWIGKIP